MATENSALFDYDIDQTIPRLDDMCLVKDFVARHQDAEPLRGINTLFIQHQLGNQVPMAEALIALGLDPQRIFWLDIPYTASSRVQYELCERLGIPAGQLWVNRYRVLEAYRPYQRRRVQELVREMLRLDLDRQDCSFRRWRLFRRSR